MPSPELIKAFLSHASSSGSRSTALQPLGYLVSILTLGLVVAANWGVPKWALILLSCLLCVTVCTFLVFYMFFAIKDPDALRSEKYTLSKMAIEKNLMGDNKAGLLEIGDYENPSTAPALPTTKRVNNEAY